MTWTPIYAAPTAAVAVYAAIKLHQARRGRKVLFNAIGRDFEPQPHHIHVVDFDRSTITVREDQTVLASCSYLGCPHQTIIGRNVVAMTIGEEAHR